MKLPEMFGVNVFNDSVQKETLPSEVYKALRATIEAGKQLDVSIAGAVASAMKKWAVSKGATHYTHWFQPLTGLTGEKHDSFIEPEGDKVIMRLTGKSLIVGESDASVFLRAVRAQLIWRADIPRGIPLRPRSSRTARCTYPRYFCPIRVKRLTIRRLCFVR